MTIGVYRIINTITQASYIGSSVCVEQRLRTHKKDLLKNVHHNQKLQTDFNIYGLKAFDVEILEDLGDDDINVDRNYLFEREQYYIDLLKTKEHGYNIADAKFGDTLTYSPNKEERIKKMRKSLLGNLDKLSVEDRKARWSKPKEQNPKWNPDIQHTCIKCGVELSNSTKHRRGTTCNACRDRTGSKNPFFGKTHSEATKTKLRKARAGKEGNNQKPLMAEGILFNSNKKAAAHFNISIALVTYRIKSHKYTDWYYLDKCLTTIENTEKSGSE